MELRGSMTRFEPLTPEIISRLSSGRLTFEWVVDILAQYNLSPDNVVYDSSRQYVNTFYADFENGAYGSLDFIARGELVSDDIATLQRLSWLTGNGNEYLSSENWSLYYTRSVPVPMLIYDLSRRYLDIAKAEVYGVWLEQYKRIDYSNGMWSDEVLAYILSCAPSTELPATNDRGLVPIYRGMGALSQAPEKAISWTADPGNALWFAIHSGRGTHIVAAEVSPDDIVSFQSGFSYENEVIVKPGSPVNIRYEDMLPATENTFLNLTLPVLPAYAFFSKQASRLGYQPENMVHAAFGNEVHGTGHILRVLLLSLIYSSHERLSKQDANILVYFSLLHDVGRTNDEVDPNHGAVSVSKIRREKLSIDGIDLSKQDRRIAHLVIEYHSKDDAVGIYAIQNEQVFSQKDRARALELYRICKDMDGLDRVRFNGLNYQMLRTEFARTLPLIAGCLLEEDMELFCR